MNVPLARPLVFLLPLSALLSVACTGPVRAETNGQGGGDSRAAAAFSSAQLQKLQDLVAENPLLNGILVTSVSYDRARSEVLVGGFRPRIRNRYGSRVSDEQKTALAKLIDGRRPEDWPAADKAPVNLDRMEVLDNLVDCVQDRLSHDNFNHVLVQRHYYQNGRLILEVLHALPESGRPGPGADAPALARERELRAVIGDAMDKQWQWQTVKAELRQLVRRAAGAGMGTPAALEPKDEDLRSIKIQRFQYGDLLGQIQDKIASDPELDGARLDDFYFDREGQMQFGGIAPPDGAQKKGPSPLVEKKLNEILSGAIRSTPLAAATPVQLKDGLKAAPFRLAAIRQLIAGNPSLDGARVDRAFYDRNKKLVLLGVVQTPQAGQEASAETPAKALAKEIYSHLRREPGDTDPQWLDTARLERIDFHALKAQLHASINGDGRVEEPLLDRLRVDRIHYDSDNALVLEGVHWDASFTQAEKDLESAIRQEVTRWSRMIFADEAWRGLSNGKPVPDLDITRIRHRPNPLVLARGLVSQTPCLDGVRFDSAYYDKTGVLHFKGAQARPEQTAGAYALLRSGIPADLWREWQGAGNREPDRVWTIDPLPIVPLERLLADVRRNIAATPQLDGTRVDRAYYDERLRLTFVGQRWKKTAPQEADNQEAIDDAVFVALKDAWREALRQPNGMSLLGDRTPSGVKELKPGFDTARIAEVEDLSEHLRSVVPLYCALDGVRLDRVFYDEQGTLQLCGLIGDDAQSASLPAFVGRTAADARWSGQIVHGLSTSRMQLAPIAPLFQFVKDVLPAYEPLDGTNLTRAYYNKDRRLAFEGRIRVFTGEKDTGALGQARKALLATVIRGELESRPQWASQWQSPGVQPVDVDLSQVFTAELKPDIFEARRLFERAKNLYWEERYAQGVDLLDQAMLYYSDDGMLWYFRALCYIGAGRIDLARRDMRRVVEMEKENRVPGNMHYTALQRVQGPARTWFESLRSDCLLNPKNGSLIHNPCAGGPGDGCPDCGPRQNMEAFVLPLLPIIYVESKSRCRSCN